MRLYWLFFSVLCSCKPPVSTVIFHSDMGKMTVALSRDIPDEASEQLDRFLAVPSDSLAVEKVLHDGFIQLNFPLSGVKSGNSTFDPALSGAFVLNGSRLYLVQGRAHTEASLDRWEKMSGRKISQAARELYIKKGGALSLEGNSIVLGKLVSGKEVLDRITALPSDATGRPLRVVRVRTEAKE